MMQQHLRLRRKEDFDRLRRSGQTFTHRLMRISIAPNHLPHNRYGFITSKRLGTAVVRNTTRRRIREVVRALHPQLKPGFDVVIIATPACTQATYGLLQETVQGLYQQARLVVSES